MKGIHSRFSLGPLNNTAGMTLIELMVVLAIVAVLASIAIPRYQTYQRRAFQTEAKVALASIYTSQKSFGYEQQSYTSCLNDIGLSPEGNNYYAVGLNEVASKYTGKCGMDGKQDCNFTVFNPSALFTCADSSSFYAGTAVVAGSKGMAAQADIPVASDVTRTTFTIGAGADLANGVQVDQWTIDDGRVLVNTQTGF